MRRRAAIMVFLVVMMGPASIGTAAAAEGGTISSVAITDRVDQDGDGKFSAFTVAISADTRVGEWGDLSTNPYFKIYVNDQLVRTTSIVSVDKYGYYTFDLSQETLSDFATGKPTVTVELWEGDPIYDDFYADKTTTPSDAFEPESKDYTTEERGLLGINSLEDPYTAAGHQLNVDYLTDQQIEDVTNAFEALLPTTQKDVQLDAATSVLEETTSVSTGWVGNLLAVPPVAANVGSSITTGKQVATLTKTDSSTRSNFHTYLDSLQQNTNAISTDPETVDDQQLKDRLDLIRTVYEYSRTYQAEVENTYTDNQQYYPEIILTLYGADQGSLEQVNGQFKQLHQNLIADYYYTQLALNPNLQPTNLTSAVGFQPPSYPEAQITDSDLPDSTTVGEPTSVTVTVTTQNAATPSQTITVGLPDAQAVKNVHITDHTLGNPAYSNVYEAGSTMWTNYGTEEHPISYPVAEIASDMSAGSTHNVEVTFTPTETGTVRLWLKTIAWTEAGASGSLVPDPRTSGNNVITDGQEELAYERTIEVTSPDSDNDGLTDQEERELGTNPNAADTDNDGLDDLVEVNGPTDPTQADSDNDGLDDGTEAFVFS